MHTLTRIARGRTREVLLVGIATSLALAVALQWGAIRSFDWRVSWLPFVGAVLLFAIGPLVGAGCFWIVLRDLSPRAELGASFVVWERSFAARYVPSGALTVAVRLHERERLGASRRQMISATVFEQVVAMASAAAVSLVALSVSGQRPPGVAVVVLAVVVAFAIAAGPAAGWWARRRTVQHGLGGALVVRTRTLAAALALCSFGWLVAGAAAWIFVASLTSSPSPAFLSLLGAYSIAWLVGFVVPIAPSGLGAREATLVAFLVPSVGLAPATALAVGLRLANVTGDFLAIGAIEVGHLVGHRWRPAGSARSVALEGL